MDNFEKCGDCQLEEYTGNKTVYKCQLLLRRYTYYVCKSHLNTHNWLEEYVDGKLTRKKVGNRIYTVEEPKAVLAERRVGNRIYRTHHKPPPTNARKVGNRIYDSNYYSDD